jgi:hypothetical protein
MTATALSATITAVGALSMAAGGAQAVEGPQLVPAAVDGIAQTVAAAVPEQLADSEVPASAAGSGTFATTGDTAVTIPASAAGKVVAQGGGVTFQVGLGTSTATSGVRASDGSVVYDQQGSVDRTVQATTDGFRIHTVIAGASAPTEFTHSLVLPTGASVVLESGLPQDPENPGPLDPGLVSGAYIRDTSGNVLGGFGSPWATDANGAKVPTHFEIRSGALVQVVEHRASGVAYPVVADPYLGRAMISSYTWAYHSGYGYTLRVAPTGWSRSLAGAYLAGVYGFRELQAKTSGTLNTNVDGMRDQYICHQQVVAVVSPTKATWNLDEWRPNVSYASTVNARCNPGGSVIWD